MTKRNLTPDRYREVTIADVDVPLTEDALTALLLGREAYRRTRFVIARSGGDVALVEVRKASEAPLFAPITSVQLLAGPDECRLVDAPNIDTAIPTELAAVARRLGPGIRCVVVRGRYGHVSFLLNAVPYRVQILETVPPRPAKLVDQVRRLLEVADDLPPIEIEPVLVDLHELAATRPNDHYLLPCRAGGPAVPGARLDYLDERPPRGDWVLVGCARSREIHRWCYGDEPPTVDACPRAMVKPGRPTLTKCCLLEEQIAVEGDVVTVPWGASLAEVKSGISAIAEVMERAWAPG
ncbi:MAG TPA: hypothetical protein VFR23_01430 [Jiangellaceae bacterium]|nr:hypothetical protein [Jiangellaceae bacterium]